MSRIAAPIALVGMFVFGCSSGEVRPPGNSGLCVIVDGGPPCRAGPADGIRNPPPTFDSSLVGTDASLDAPETSAAPMEVTGQLRLFPTLPPGMASAARSNGWTITERPLPDPDAGVITPLQATTGNLGVFTLAGLPVVGVAPGAEVSSYWLEATFPVMGGIGSLFEVPAGVYAPVIDTFDDNTLREVMTAAGLVQADDRAVITVLVRESRAPDARPVTGVVLQADGQASASLYDGVGGSVEIAVSGTGPLGFAILPNVAVPTSGDGFVTLSGPRLSRAYSIRVRRRTMSVVLVTAS